MSTPTPVIRPAAPRDAEALARIYGYHVLHGDGSFETTPPSAEEMAKRVAAIQETGLPWLVAEIDGAVMAYAYAHKYKERAAYGYTVEDSVYVDHTMAGRGLGRALLTQVLDICASLGYRQMMGVIGDSGNAGSIALHKSLGFRMIGTAEAIGFKHGSWVDVVFMQKALGTGSDAPPG